MAAKARPESVKRVLKAYEERKAGHEKLVSLVEQRRKAYMAILEDRSEAAAWTSKLTPPYAMQIADTVVANLVDDNTRFKVRARPRMGDTEEIRQMLAGARALELLLSFQLDQDRFAEKQYTSTLQNVIAGWTVTQQYWKTIVRPRTKTSVRHELVMDANNEPVGLNPVLEEVEEPEYVEYDDPCIDVVDVRQFLWEEGAQSLSKAGWCARIHHMRLEELYALAQAGVMKKSAIDELMKGKERPDSINDEFRKLDTELFGTKGNKDRIEVIDWWGRENDGSITNIMVGNRQVELGERESPYHHGRYPFTTCSTRPDLFRIPGRSIIESVRHLQTALWSFVNQRIDNIKLMNNAIFMVGDYVDPDSLEFYPGAKWPASKEQVDYFTPDPATGQISLQSEAMLKGDMQNVTGGMPFLSGTSSQNIDQETATGVSIVTTLAQRMVAAQKQQLNWANEDIAYQWICLDQQFIKDKRLVSIVGREGAQAFKEIFPEDIEGEYYVNIESVSKTMMEQERKGEAQARLQVMAQIAPLMQAIGQPINMRAAVEDYLRAFEEDDMERYFSMGQPQIPQGPGQPGSPPNGPQGPGGAPPQGVTAPQAYAPSSPSNAVSQSGEQFMARSLAMRGGPNNV